VTALAQAGVYKIPAQERIVFGEPAGETVVAEVARLGAQRVFLTSSASLARLADGPLQQVQRALGERCVGVYSAMRAHSPREDVVAAANAAREARADLLVAVGGGSVIDGTKAALVCLWHGLHTPEAMAPFLSEGSAARAIEAPVQPVRMLSVSTTLSAADFTSRAGVTDSATRAKQGFGHALLVPQVAVLDPRATLHTPLRLLLSTGIRAVDHAVESHCAPRSHVMSSLHAIEGLRLLARALPAIHDDPQALEPRSEAQLGMWQAIWGSSTGGGTGASHGIGYALGAGFDIAHGDTSCVMLAPVLRHNEPVNADRQQALLRAMSRSEATLADAIAGLVRQLGLPTSLQALGLRRDDLDEVARRSLAYPPVRANPRPIRNEADVREILELAWQGIAP
jgi:maleylacetate reductase